jgi:diaminohydroxyphosphoribosylaminopyrimidine deaminase/5-amino-6-(5-phosphoribosylamino)uracil reductase
MNLNQRIEQWLVESKDTFHAAAARPGRRGRPQVTLCYAQSWDGSLTTRPGETLTLSSATATQLTHQIRSLHDGILVGIGTVLADDPRLTVREWSGRSPQPIVLDSQLRMPPTSKLCNGNGNDGGKRCWVLTTHENLQPRHDCELIAVAGKDGHVDLQAALEQLHARGITSLMVEGGASVITAFLRARLADSVVLTISPTLVGGYKAVGELGYQVTQAFPAITPLHSERVGDEIFLWGSLCYPQDRP